MPSPSSNNPPMCFEIEEGRGQSKLETKDMKDLRESIIRYCKSDKFKTAGKFVQETLERLRLYVDGQNYRRWEKDCEDIDDKAEEEREQALGAGNASFFGCFTAPGSYYKNQVALVLHRYRTVKNLFELAKSDDLCALYTHISMVSHQVVGSADFPVGGWPSSSLHKAFVELQQLTTLLRCESSVKRRVGGEIWKDELEQSRLKGFNQGLGLGKRLGEIEGKVLQMEERLNDKKGFYTALEKLDKLASSNVSEIREGLRSVANVLTCECDALAKGMDEMRKESSQLSERVKKTAPGALWHRANEAGPTPTPTRDLSGDSEADQHGQPVTLGA